MQLPVLPACVAICLGFTAPVGADELPAHILNLAKIEHAMSGELKRLPNYTCLETIDRYTASTKSKPKPFDRIRINVAVVDGRELYAWPGANSFDDRSLVEMVTTGFISDGDFGSMSRAVFMNRVARITFTGNETKDGRALLHYDFRIPQMLSGWQFHLRNLRGIVGAAGSFWADAATFDVVRLSFHAEDLPSWSPDKAVAENVKYGRVRIGDAMVLLPLEFDISAETFAGVQRLNHGTFGDCRQYTSESVISFDETKFIQPNAAVVSDTAARALSALPGGLTIEMRLDKAIDSTRAAVGDAIRAVVSKDVRVNGETVLPRGSVAKGVIRTFDRHEGNRLYYAVGLEFTEVEYKGHRAVFSGRLEDIQAFQFLHRDAIGFIDSAGTDTTRRIPGLKPFYVEGDPVHIPAGVILTWRTVTAVSP